MGRIGWCPPGAYGHDLMHTILDLRPGSKQDQEQCVFLISLWHLGWSLELGVLFFGDKCHLGLSKIMICI
jgi:hypothetical protein